jgi:hypothetical protein
MAKDKIKKEKVPKQAKVKANKSKKSRRKINFKNYKSTNGAIIIAIFWFRIIMIVFLFTYPFVFAMTSMFDRGVKQLLFYTVESIPVNVVKIFSFGSLVSGTESISRIVPYTLWLICGAATFLVFFLPFFNSKTKGSKGFLSFYYLMIGGIGIGLIYALQFLFIDWMPHQTYDMSNWNEMTQRDLYWNEMKNFFRFDSLWMIMNQIFHCVTIVFGLWCAIESDLIRRNKLKYTDLLVNMDKSNSLANKVLQGQLEFGNVPDENLHLSINKLKAKLNIDLAMNEELKREEYEQTQSRQEEISMNRGQSEQDVLEKEIKEAI